MKELTESQCKALASLPGRPEWEALLDLFENEIEQANESHLLAYRDPEQFRSSGLISVAMKLFAGNIEAKVTLLGQQVIETKEIEKLEKKVKNFQEFTFREMAEAI